MLFKAAGGAFTTVPEYLERNKERAENRVFYAEDGDAHKLLGS